LIDWWRPAPRSSDFGEWQTDVVFGRFAVRCLRELSIA